MSSNRHNRLFLIIIFLCSSLTCSGTSSSSVQQLSSCLAGHGVGNFTALSNDTGHSGSGKGDDNPSTLYYSLLNFSIHNLRFSGSSVPKPAVIILPESLEQLVSAVGCCRDGQWEIRVRCGGHSYEGTSSVAADGAPFVIIDMMNLNKVEVDMQAEMAWVEGGATLGEVYSAIAEASPHHGFSAGSCPTVGVGGHISGGGFGLLSRKYGLAADNVEDALLVDSSGQLFDRRTMGEDVFWAIRGGGGGIWGIVYAWKIKLLPVPKTVTSFIISRMGRTDNRTGRGKFIPELVKKWQYVAPSLGDDFYLSVFVGANLHEAREAPQISATFKGFFLGPRRRAVSIMNRAFPELGLTEEDCHEMSWIESILFFSGLGDGSSVSDLKSRFSKDKLYFKAKSDYIRSPIPMSGINSALNILDREPKGYVILDPYGGMMDNISNDFIAFPHRKGNLFTIQYLVEWHEEDDCNSEQYIEWIREFYASMAPHVSEGPRAAYINYIDLDLGVMGLKVNLDEDCKDCDDVDIARQWGEKYFLGNYERLVRAKTLIDPSNVFRNEQGIPPMPNLNKRYDRHRSSTQAHST
ncbi:reticuline oxidase-like [Punica granatum]|uniref:FAD-binding PCMH-type domain-containing protein n=2 Tax=Punica granatum TaxID=22663 RepID=A0A218WIH3_PUNGR|nr:reticuline oxidase-like [Punica granatum]OWM72615.1 hypothetical protein CDL15_Pgr013083 [Punica granatum]PKI49729.1 hypothetical protein CRG98_029877 [Punica granatum]